MVSTSGSSTEETQPSSASPAPRWCQEARSRWRTSSTSWARRVRRRSQTSVLPIRSRPVQRLVSPVVMASSARSAPISAAPSRTTAGSIQVAAWTPLVTEVIGTSAASKPGQRPLNIERLTSPCRVETPLARWASRRPMAAMLNSFGSPPRQVSAPSASTCSTGTPGSAVSPPKCRATSSRSNRSMPAGTGVWVVKRVPARTDSSAAVKSSPASATSSRIRSTPRKPAWPSLVWKTSGAGWPVSRW